MKAEIVSIGTELLMGEITDTNATYLTNQLTAFGMETTHVTQVRDDLDEIVDILSLAWNRSKIIVVTGGLGPTHDDLTRDAIAKLFNEELYRDPNIENHIKQFLSNRTGRTPASINLRQADIIPSAQPILNTAGTAPGLLIQSDEKVLLSMPGVPHEMEKMWQEAGSTIMANANTNLAIKTRTIKTFGLSESAVSDLIPEILSEKDPYTGIYAKPDGIHLRIISMAPSSEEANEKLINIQQAIVHSLKEFIWGWDEDTPAGVLGALLTNKGATIATMESMTGGLIGSTITDVPGSSAYYKGGFITYETQAKTNLGVSQNDIHTYGVVSPQVALSMAKRTIELTNADVGISITGSAGPTAAEKEEPGTYYIGIQYKDKGTAINGTFRSDRLAVKLRATTHAIIETVKLLNSV